MADWPAHGSVNWDTDLKTYIDAGDAPEPGAAPGGSSLLSIAGGAPVIVADTFQRSDRSLPADIAPTGQKYTRGGSDAITITNGRADFSAVQTGTADIIYADCVQPPTAIAAEFVPVSGVTAGSALYDMVIGTANVGFGSGSIQLGVTTNDWYLFVVENPIVDPYPRIAAGTFDTPLVEGQTYQAALHYDAENSAITIVLPGQSSDGGTQDPGSDGNFATVAWHGTGGTVSHPDINTYWGTKFGFQCRRMDSINAGFVQFAAVEARGETTGGGSSGGGGTAGTVMQAGLTPITVSNASITTLMYAFEPAGGQVAGQTTYRLRACGRFDSIANGGSFDIQLRGRKGPTDAGAPQYAVISISPGMPSAVSGLAWWFDVDIYVDATDPGTVSVFGAVVSYTNTQTNVDRVVRQVGTASDLSTGMEVAIDVKMATADPGNTVYLDRALFQQIA